MSVQIDQHLIIWPIAIKGIWRKQYGQIAFTVAVQISFHNYFARKIRTSHWKLESTKTESSFTFLHLKILKRSPDLVFVQYFPTIIFYFTCPQYLFYCSASLSAALVRVNALSIQFIRREARKVTFRSSYFISGQSPDTHNLIFADTFFTGDQYALWCVTMSGASWSPWHRIDWGHTGALPSNERPGMISEDQSEAAATHLPESPAVSELPWWILSIVTNADIWCYVPPGYRNVYQ